MNPMDEIQIHLLEASIAMQGKKPNDRSDLDRHYAVLITDLEKLLTLYCAWIVDESPEELRD